MKNSITVIDQKLNRNEKEKCIANYATSHFKTLTSFAQGKVRDRDLAQSIVQEAFYKLSTKVLVENKTIHNVHKYMITIILNETRNIFRKNTSRPMDPIENRPELDDQEQTWISKFEQKDLLQQIVDLANLTEDEKKIFELLKNGDTPADIVKEMGLGDKEVYRRLRFTLIRKLQKVAQKKKQERN